MNTNLNSEYKNVNWDKIEILDFDKIEAAAQESLHDCFSNGDPRAETKELATQKYDEAIAKWIWITE